MKYIQYLTIAMIGLITLVDANIQIDNRLRQEQIISNQKQIMQMIEPKEFRLGPEALKILDSLTWEQTIH